MRCARTSILPGLAFLTVGLTSAVAAPTAPALHVQASLIGPRTTPDHKGPLWLGIRMIHQPGWHTYWSNPGDAGMPTRITWHLPVGWRADAIDWPAPVRLPSGPLASYGYIGDIVLPVMLFPTPDWQSTPVHLSATVSWLACAESCIPETLDVELDLPDPDARDGALLERALLQTPEAFDFRLVRATRHNGRLEITLEPAGPGEFFPEEEELIDPGPKPQVRLEGKQWIWSAPLGDRGKRLQPGAHITGIWVQNNARPRRVDAVLETS